MEAIGKIRQKMGPRKKHVIDNVRAAQSLIETYMHDNVHVGEILKHKERLETHMAVYRSLHDELERAASESKIEEECRKVKGESDEYYEFEIMVDGVMADLRAKLSDIQIRSDTTHKDMAQSVEDDFEMRKLKLQEDVLEMEKEKLHFEKEKMQREINEKSKTTSDTKVSTVKLPKLDFDKFSGNVLKYQEFWDSFESAVHRNEHLNPVDKMNYLRSKLEGEAKTALSGLSLTNENYKIAINILKERFGNKQLVISAHHNQLMKISPCSDKTSTLRKTYDCIEKHLRSLEALGTDVNNAIIISVIMDKLPARVIIDLTTRKGSTDGWSVMSLRQTLSDYIITREFAERQSGFSREHVHDEQEYCSNQYEPTDGATTTQALLSAPPSRNKFHNKQPLTCIYCDGLHWSDQCDKYLTVQARKEKIKGRCFSCLKPNHIRTDCIKKKSCVYCQQHGNHHRSLCTKRFPMGNSGEFAQAAIEGDIEPATMVTEHSYLASGEQVLMQTADTEVRNLSSTRTAHGRILFDSGSQRSFITSKLAEQLQLHATESESLRVYTFSSPSPKEVITKQAEIGIRLKDDAIFRMKVNVVPNISGVIQRAPVSEEIREKITDRYDLADSLLTSSEPATIDILIGNDYYWELYSHEEERRMVAPGLFLVPSKLGWILSGRLKSTDTVKTSMSMLTYTSGPLSSIFHLNDQIDIENEKMSLEDFWKLDTLGIKSESDRTDDQKAFDIFNDNVSFNTQESRYEVTWPWKEENPPLPENYELAVGRLKSLVGKLTKKPGVIGQYDDIIQEQVKRGIIEKVAEEKVGVPESERPKHYVPHHEIVTPEKTTTKMRIVFDASAKTKRKNPSLNECLYRGPVILEDMCGLLIRFRMKPVALVADIEKAFLQIGLQQTDRDVTRFLWLKDLSKPALQDNLQIYRFKRIPFGVVSSPFLLAATLCHALDKVGTSTAEQIKRNMYVDNFISGVQSPSHATEFYGEAKEIFSAMSMNLREWASNAEEFLTNIPETDRALAQHVKVLGMSWNTQSDTLALNTMTLCEEHHEVTKRDVLKAVSSVYDPLGLMSPITLQGKVLLQEIWKEELDWDEKLNSTHQQDWKRIKTDLIELATITVPRFIGGEELQLFCFCDASKKAYATVVYLGSRIGTHQNANLLFSKARVAPKKQLSIPRLELMAVLIGTRVMKFLSDQLHLPVIEKTIWTDSKCVLHWLSKKSTLPRFVQNRVTEITSHQDVKFRYVGTIENPADYATRGKTLKQLTESDLWWHGPGWLTLPKQEWPSCEIPEVDHETVVKLDTEGTDSKIMYEMSHLAGENTSGVDTQFGSVDPPFQMEVEQYSSLKRLLRVTAWCLRFIQKIQKDSAETGELKTHEIVLAKQKWELSVQKSCYGQEVAAIKNSDEKSNLKDQLGLELDAYGLIRCHGRLGNADISLESMFPKLLPRKHPYTDLVVRDVHHKIFHSGTSHTLANVRKEYWIPKGRTTVKSALLRCRVCRKHLVGPYRMPKMPDYPSTRVNRSSPFTYTGLDYLGPLYVKNEDGTSKVWVCLFTCLAVRAIHLDLVRELSAEAFLESLRRFIARRGTPKQFISDNAANFKVTGSVISEAWEPVKTDPGIQSYMSNQGIEWKFITEFSPWMGGFYERLVALVKNCLKRSIGKVCLTYDKLSTFLVESEAVINSRPLEYVGEGFEDSHCITPADFLCMNSQTGAPNLYTSDDTDPDFPTTLSTGPKVPQSETFIDTFGDFGMTITSCA